LEVRCPQCQAMLALPDSTAGKRALCPRCSSEFRVPLAFDSSFSGDDPPDFSSGGERRDDIGPALGPIRRGPSGFNQSLIRCPSCDRTLAVDPTMAGHPIICPTCKRRLRVPTAWEAAEGGSSNIRYGTLDERVAAAPWQASPTAANPYVAAPVQPAALGPAVSQTNYALPGMLIMVLTAFESLFLVFAFAGLMADALAGGAKGDTVFALSFLSVSLLINALVFGGGFQMTRRQSLGWAKGAAFAALLPCGLCTIFRIPVAIWAIVLLSRSVAEDDFGSRLNA